MNSSWLHFSERCSILIVTFAIVLVRVRSQTNALTRKKSGTSMQKKSVVIINGMADVQSMGKPTWVRNDRDLASHFLEIIDSSPRNVKRSTSFFIVMTFQILSSREFASFTKVAKEPWCTQSPMVQSSKRSLSNSC